MPRAQNPWQDPAQHTHRKTKNPHAGPGEFCSFLAGTLLSSVWVHGRHSCFLFSAREESRPFPHPPYAAPDSQQKHTHKPECLSCPGGQSSPHSQAETRRGFEPCGVTVGHWVTRGLMPPYSQLPAQPSALLGLRAWAATLGCTMSVPQGGLPSPRGSHRVKAGGGLLVEGGHQPRVPSPAGCPPTPAPPSSHILFLPPWLMALT